MVRPFSLSLYTTTVGKQQNIFIMAKNYYDKFTKKKNSAIKEGFKQAKRKEKKERAAAINRYYEEKRKQKAEPANTPRVSTSKVPLTQTRTQPKTTDNKFEEMPLNKYVAHCGICSRRDAVELVKSGKVTVNGTAVTEPAHKVSDKDEIRYNGKIIFISKNLVYILLNKPKDYITTTDDPQGRKTVLQLIKNATTERVYPIGRLDRNTSGVLLLTNDGELTQKLSHPSYNITKLYEARLDKPLAKTDLDRLLKGIRLEDGEIKADSVGYADARDKSVIGIEIHSGRNRIVRRMFEFLGYDVKGLDRVMYAFLTKKNVERGKWRFLTEKEIRQLKYLNNNIKK